MEDSPLSRLVSRKATAILAGTLVTGPDRSPLLRTIRGESDYRLAPSHLAEGVGLAEPPGVAVALKAGANLRRHCDTYNRSRDWLIMRIEHDIAVYAHIEALEDGDLDRRLNVEILAGDLCSQVGCLLANGAPGDFGGTWISQNRAVLTLGDFGGSRDPCGIKTYRSVAVS